MNKRVLVGLSGGVDSAVAAYLLQQQGYDVTCAFMRNWDSLTNDDILGNPTLNESQCTQEKDYRDAQSVAHLLGLPLERIDFIEEYWEEVFQTFLQEYQKGRTPNPDILCNRYIKFDHFYTYAKSLGFDMLATGHYAQIKTFHNENVLCKAKDSNKDQSYFLCEVKKATLDHVLFPLGEITKPQVRSLADKLHLSIAKKKDSTGICFIGERKFRQFLSNYLPMKPGLIKNVITKEVVGEHQGVLYYTIGQRKGLNIGGTGPYFVVGKNVIKNELYVTDCEDESWLYSTGCLVSDFHPLITMEDKFLAGAKFRYRQPDQQVSVTRLNDTLLRLDYPQTVRAVTPGQEAVIYLDDVMVGGGKIEQVFQNDEDLMERILARME